MSVGIATGGHCFSDTGVHSRGFSDTAGQQLSDGAETSFRLPHHGGGERGQGSCGGNGQSSRLGERMVHTGEQMVQEGQQLIEQGDYEEGEQLVNEGAMLEQQGATLEAQAGGGMGGPTTPVGLNPGGPMDPMMPPGGQDPCSPMNPGPIMPVGFSNGGAYSTQFPMGMNGFGGGYGQNSGCAGMSVDTANNTITVGDYTITATPDAAGTLTCTDNCTGKSFKIWGDPHISTANGGTADFQQKSATFELPNGAQIHVQPTGNPTGPNTMQHVIVTYGNHAATFDFANGQVQTQDLPGQGYALDETTPAGVRVDALPNGQLAVENGASGDIPIGPNTGNIDQYATNTPMGFGSFDPIGNGMPTNGNNSQLISQIQQSLAQIEQAIGQIEQGASMTAGFTGFGSKFC
jgi:hypothetical protein